jgi:SOS-response transcriptional repressor LexA
MSNREPTPQEMLESMGRALSPHVDWQARLADLMGVRADTIRHWMTGRMTLRPDHFESLLKVLADRQVEMRNAEADLRNWLARQPKGD